MTAVDGPVIDDAPLRRHQERTAEANVGDQPLNDLPFDRFGPGIGAQMELDAEAMSTPDIGLF